MKLNTVFWMVERLWMAEMISPDNQSDKDVEQALIMQASKGCLDAFNQLVLRYQDIAYHHAYALIGDSTTAEDITQESFIKAFKHIHRFQGISFRAWLLKIVTNTSYDLLRQLKRHHIQSLFLIDDDGEEFEPENWLTDPSLSVEEKVEQNEDARTLNQMLDELPPIFRSVLILVDLYEIDYSEVAEILKIPVGTVKSRVARARLQMRRKLQNDSFRIMDRVLTYRYE